MMHGPSIPLSRAYAAEHGLLAAGQDVITGGAYAEELPHVVAGAALDVGVEAQGSVGSDEAPRIGDCVGDSYLSERRQVRKGVIKVIGPIKRGATRAEPLLTGLPAGQRR